MLPGVLQCTQLQEFRDWNFLPQLVAGEEFVVASDGVYEVRDFHVLVRTVSVGDNKKREKSGADL